MTSPPANGQQQAETIQARNMRTVSSLINEGLNQKQADVALRLAAPDFVDGDAFHNQPDGPEGLMYHFEVLNRFVPDLKVEFVLVAQGNTVYEDWTGSGNQVQEFFGPMLEQPRPITQRGISVFTFNEEGQIIERRTFQRGNR